MTYIGGSSGEIRNVVGEKSSVGGIRINNVGDSNPHNESIPVFSAIHIWTGLNYVKENKRKKCEFQFERAEQARQEELKLQKESMEKAEAERQERLKLEQQK